MGGSHGTFKVDGVERSQVSALKRRCLEPGHRRVRATALQSQEPDQKEDHLPSCLHAVKLPPDPIPQRRCHLQVQLGFPSALERKKKPRRLLGC